MSTSVTESPSAPRVLPRVSRILWAFSEEEKAIFLPHYQPELFSAIDCRWFDPRQRSLGAWSQMLHDFRPDVLVSSWTTPRLIEEEDGTFPVKYVCHVAGTIRHIVPRAFLEQGGIVTNWGGMAAPQVAEHALLLALAALRHITAWKSVAETLSSTSPHPILQVGTRTLMGRRVGIHGFGHIARELIRLLQPFGVKIVCYSKGVPPDLIAKAGVVPCENLGAVLARSEVFFECEALTPESAGSVTGEMLSMLPDESVVVNVGRAQVVDETALYRETASGRIRVALDVVSEPTWAASSFLTLPGVIVSPHIGGPTEDRFAACGELAMRNLQRYGRGEPLESRVTLEIYDRST